MISKRLNSLLVLMVPLLALSSKPTSLSAGIYMWIQAVWYNFLSFQCFSLFQHVGLVSTTLRAGLRVYFSKNGFCVCSPKEYSTTCLQFDRFSGLFVLSCRKEGMLLQGSTVDPKQADVKYFIISYTSTFVSFVPCGMPCPLYWYYRWWRNEIVGQGGWVTLWFPGRLLDGYHLIDFFFLCFCIFFGPFIRMARAWGRLCLFRDFFFLSFVPLTRSQWCIEIVVSAV